MRKFSVAFLMIMIPGISLMAQYKKATFFNKTGRTYEFGASFHFLPDGDATGFYYSAGIDKGNNRTFQWFDLGLILPSKFSYVTQSVEDQYSPGRLIEPVTVSSKTTIAGYYRFNYGIYLTDNTKGDKKFLPYVAFGAKIFVGGGANKENTTYTGLSNNSYYYESVERRPSTSAFGFGLNGGAGLIFNFSRKVGLRLAGGYDLQYNTNIDFADDNGEKKSKYYFFKSHPYATLGVRLRIERESD